MLRCLTDKLDDISDEGCRKEVFYYEKMEVSNFKNDILLAEACRTDVEQFCSTVEPGGSRFSVLKGGGLDLRWWPLSCRP